SIRRIPPPAAQRGQAGEACPRCAAAVVGTNLDAGPGRGPAYAYALYGEVEAVQIHHLGPRGHEVAHELLLRVVTRVDLREGSKLGVRTEDEIDGRGGPLDLARGAIATL